MKNPFAQYPKVFYQLVWLFIIAIICLVIGIFDVAVNYQSLLSIFQFFDPTPYTLLIVSGLYILFGYIVDKTQDIKKSIEKGVRLILIGFVISSLLGFIGPVGSSISGWGVLIGTLLVIIGAGVISLASIIHIGVLFPVANDWKENAFTILYFYL